MPDSGGQRGRGKVPVSWGCHPGQVTLPGLQDNSISFFLVLFWEWEGVSEFPSVNTTELIRGKACVWESSQTCI
jgi:hypothetical protein